MTCEVEERIHRALNPHALARIENGYRRVHFAGAGTSTLRLLPVAEVGVEPGVVAVAEILAEYDSTSLPPFSGIGIQRLNSWAVHGAYELDRGRLSQKAQYSIYSNETSVHLAVQSILNAFGAQLPLGRSTALATTSPAVLKQQRAHHAMPSHWEKPLNEQALTAAVSALRQQGLAASNSATAVWAEFPLSGDCPSRAVDPRAETALLQVNAGVPHPIAGAGYLATISLPLATPPPNAAEVCRRLNQLEFEQVDFVPRLGAWGLHAPDDLPAYCCFIPSAEPLDGLHMTLMWWCVKRVAWLRSRIWSAPGGLSQI